MQLSLIDIALRRHSLNMQNDFSPAVADWSDYVVEMKAGVASCTLLPKEKGRTLVRYIVTTGLRWKLAADTESVAVTVEAEYGLVFAGPEDFDIQAQGEGTLREALCAAWPYWRQDFLQMATKASLPAIPISAYPDFEKGIF